MSIEQYAQELDYCSFCPKLCRHSCPVSNVLGSETLIPQSKMHLLNMQRKGAVPWTAAHMAPLYACTGCNLCQQNCLHGNDVAAALFSGRQEAARREWIPPALADLSARFHSRAKRLRRRLDDAVPRQRMATRGDIGYLPGCDAVDQGSSRIREAIALLDSLRIGQIPLVDAPIVCAGYPLWAAGQVDSARAATAELMRQVRRFGTVVCDCPACTYLLRNARTELGMEHNSQILHISEFLAAHAESLPFRRTRPAAYYHDPCYLGRHLGVYDAPRNLLDRCVDSRREFFHSRERAQCCGGGGLVPLTYPEAAVGQAALRLQEPTMFAVDLVVTACPTCVQTLKSADTSLEIADLVSLLAWATEPRSRP